MHCCFLSLKKHIFGKCPVLEQILHLCLLVGHLDLSLCWKSPHHVQSLFDLGFWLPLFSFHKGWLFLCGCDDCCCWFDWLHFLLPFGFWYFFWVTCVHWWQSKLTEAFAPVFALVDKYCLVALFCSIVFAKFFMYWGLKCERLGFSFDNCSITCCVVPWLLKLNRKASLWNALCSLGLKLHRSHSLSILL